MLQFAIKTITKKSVNSAQEKFHIQREIDIQSKLRHPHIISVCEGLCIVFGGWYSGNASRHSYSIQTMCVDV